MRHRGLALAAALLCATLTTAQRLEGSRDTRPRDCGATTCAVASEAWGGDDGATLYRGRALSCNGCPSECSGCSGNRCTGCKSNEADASIGIYIGVALGVGIIAGVCRYCAMRNRASVMSSEAGSSTVVVHQMPEGMVMQPSYMMAVPTQQQPHMQQGYPGMPQQQQQVYPMPPQQQQQQQQHYMGMPQQQQVGMPQQQQAPPGIAYAAGPPPGMQPQYAVAAYPPQYPPQGQSINVKY
jgi:hypothetical protein